MAEDAERGTRTPSRADDKRAYSVKETEACLGVSVRLVAKAIANGTLASFKVGDRRLVPVDAVEELLAQAYVRAASM